MDRPDPDREEGPCTFTDKHFKTICALLGSLAVILSVGVGLCVSYVFLDKTEITNLDVIIHPFHHTKHDPSEGLEEKPHLDEVELMKLKIAVLKENLTYLKNGYNSFTLTKSIVEESQSIKQIRPDMKLVLEMLTAPVNILMKEGSIVEVNNSNKFGPFTGPCNKVQGSDGFLFPIPLTREEKLYDPIAKQVVPLARIHSTGDTTYYEPNESYLATEEYYPENACYANRQAEVEDPKDGIRYIENGIIISQPHFLDGDPRLVDNVEGLLPDKKKHGIKYTVDTKTGETLKSRFTFQFNAQHKGTILPSFWVEVIYTRAKPPYNEVFYVGLALIGLAVFGGALVLIGICIKKHSDKKVYYPVRKEQLEELSKEIPTMNQRPAGV